MLFFGRMGPADRPESRPFFLKHGFPIDNHSIGRDAAGVDGHADVFSGDRCRIDFLDDGDVIAVGDRKFEVIWTPGHAPGHCVIYLRKEKVMIVGDHSAAEDYAARRNLSRRRRERESARRLHRFATQGAAL